MWLDGVAVSVLARAVCAVVQIKGRAVQPAGRPHLLRLAEQVIRAKGKVRVSEQRDVLSGYSFDLSVDDRLLAGAGGGLAVVNHFSACPLGIVSNAIAVAHSFKTAFGVEPTVIFGMGASVVTLLRGRVNMVTDIVMVGGLRLRLGRFDLMDLRRHTSSEVLGRLRLGRMVCIYPESKNSRELLAGDFRAGRIILHAVEEAIPVYPVSVYFENMTFHVRVGRPLDRERVLDTAGVCNDKMSTGQSIVDYAMQEIAAQLPFELRGAYASTALSANAVATTAK